MKLIKKLPLPLVSLISIFLLIFLLTTLNYFDIFGNTLTNILIFSGFFILIFYNSFKISKNKTQKGWLEGIKIASIVLVIWLGLKLVFNPTFSLNNLFYVIGIYITSIMGGIIGINAKKSSKF